MSLVGMGQVSYAGLSPGNCADAGGVYDGDTEECMAPGTATGSGSTVLPSGFTVAQAQALCATSAAGVWNSDTNTCDPIASAAVTSCPNNTLPGTPSDVNCPWWCNLPPAELIFSACTPCSTTCPAGTVWDTTNDVCSSTPVTTNCNSNAAAPCPSYCTIPLIGNLVGGCSSACSPSMGSALAAVGAVALLFFLFSKK